MSQADEKTINGKAFPSASAALAVLDQARVAFSDYQTQATSELDGAQAELAEVRRDLTATRAELAALQKSVEQMRFELLASHEHAAKLAHERDALQDERDALQIHRSELEHERDGWRHDCDAHYQAHQAAVQAHQTAIEAHRESAAQMTAKHGRAIEAHHLLLEEQVERNRTLRHELLELYHDLRASNLPSLVLRIAVSLTKSECGLFVEADGDGTLADIGLKDLPSDVQEELFVWTRRAAHANEPMVENDGQKLADGRTLVNLAALPVAIKSTLKGVILVANKRDGDYSEDDTELLLSIGRHAGVALENQRLHCALTDSFHSTIAVLADAIEAKDAYTRGHCDNVAAMAVEVARRLGLEGDVLEEIRYAALLHDVGKIGIPDGVLLKPGKLMPEEYSMIKRHASIGSDLMARVPSLQPIASIILHHHERIDGNGYPSGLAGEGIALSSRIICVVDAFDAMTTPRPYREPVSFAEALEELERCSGTHFDAGVVAAMHEILSERAS